MSTQDHPLVALARETIENHVRTGKTIAAPKELTEEMKLRRGVFVSLHRPDGVLRGCIGTIEPMRVNVAEEIIYNAISAAEHDPRFSPLRPEELEGLDVSVDVLTEPEAISSFEELDPRVYGVIVQHGHKRGLLLPELEGVDTVEQQVSIALQKAWISPRDSYEMYRFRVVRYHKLED